MSGPRPTGNPTERSSRRSLRDWRLARTSKRKYDSLTLSVALVALGVGVVASEIVARAVGSTTAALATITLWGLLLAAIVFALSRSVPRGLYAFRLTDILWGVGVAVLLRFSAGELGAANSSTFPVWRGWTGDPWAIFRSDVFLAASLAPIVEELFFRGVILIAVFQIFRPNFGTISASLTALILSTAGFVLAHGIFSPLSLTDGMQLAAVGALFSLIVLLTGRIWGAVLGHVMYNLSFLALMLIGSIFA